jgi:hypothetical protein
MVKKLVNAITVGFTLLMFVCYTTSFITYYMPNPNGVQIISADVNQPLILWISFIGSFIFLFKALFDALNDTRPY